MRSYPDRESGWRRGGKNTRDELELAPEEVREFLPGLPQDQLEIVSTSLESDELREAMSESRL